MDESQPALQPPKNLLFLERPARLLWIFRNPLLQQLGSVSFLLLKQSHRASNQVKRRPSLSIYLKNLPPRLGLVLRPLLKLLLKASSPVKLARLSWIFPNHSQQQLGSALRLLLRRSLKALSQARPQQS